MTPEQMREARLLLGLSQEQLGDMADLSASTVEDFELGGLVHFCLVDALQFALEAVGVEFIAENGGGAGVRMRKTGKVGEEE